MTESRKRASDSTELDDQPSLKKQKIEKPVEHKLTPPPLKFLPEKKEDEDEGEEEELTAEEPLQGVKLSELLSNPKAFESRMDHLIYSFFSASLSSAVKVSHPNEISFTYNNVHFYADFFYIRSSYWTPNPKDFLPGYKIPKKMGQIIVYPKNNSVSVLSVTFDLLDTRFVELYDVKKAENISGTFVIEMFKNVILHHLTPKTVYLQDAMRIESANYIILNRVTSVIRTGKTSYEKLFPGLYPIAVKNAGRGWYPKLDDSIKPRMEQNPAIFFAAKKNFAKYTVDDLLKNIKYEEKTVELLREILKNLRLTTSSLLSQFMQTVLDKINHSSSSEGLKNQLNELVCHLFLIKQFYRDINGKDEGTIITDNITNQLEGAPNQLTKDLHALAYTRFFGWSVSQQKTVLEQKTTKTP